MERHEAEIKITGTSRRCNSPYLTTFSFLSKNWLLLSLSFKRKTVWSCFPLLFLPNSNSIIVQSKYEQIWKRAMKKQLQHKQRTDGRRCMSVTTSEIVWQVYGASVWRMVVARSIAVHLKGMCEIKCVEEKTRANAVSLLGQLEQCPVWIIFSLLLQLRFLPSEIKTLPKFMHCVRN